MANDAQPLPKTPSETALGASRFTSHALFPWAALILYFLALLRTAWLSDDAFITLRALDNLVGGYGLVSDPPDRVLGFTNPLWALVLLVPSALGTDPYWAAMGAALVVSSAATLFVVLRTAPTRPAATLAALLLAMSAAYVDFSTSGLENPLAHLLLAIFFTAFLAGRLDPARPTPWLLAALIAFNRHDHGLLVAPALVSLVFTSVATREPINFRQRLRALMPIARAALLGSLPLLLWFAFALVYYGFPFPNTAYAKLNTHVPSSTLARQGLVYFADGLKRDPLTLFAITLACFGLVRDRSRQALAVLAGLLLFLAYLVRIGGDFMAGRFFTAPFIVAVVWLAARELPRAPVREIFGVAALTAALGLWFPTNFQPSDKLDCNFDASGIANERGCYAEFTSLSNNLRQFKYQEEGRYVHGDELRRERRRVAVESNVGMTGYAAGPDIHVIDLLALTDPLLARIPYEPHDDFRIGHFHRDAPAGYELSIRTGRNRLRDPCLHAYYDALLPVIRGPIFTLERWQAIWGFHTGKYDWLMRSPCGLVGAHGHASGKR